MTDIRVHVLLAAFRSIVEEMPGATVKGVSFSDVTLEHEASAYSMILRVGFEPLDEEANG